MIKEMRKELGMTQKEFAEYLGVSKRTIESWEQGKRRCPDYVIRLIQSKIFHEFLIQQ